MWDDARAAERASPSRCRRASRCGPRRGAVALARAPARRSRSARWSSRRRSTRTSARAARGGRSARSSTATSSRWTSTRARARARSSCPGCATSRCAGSGRDRLEVDGRGARSRSRAGTTARWSTRTAKCSRRDCDGELPQFTGPGRHVARDGASATARSRQALAPLALRARAKCGCRRAAAGSCSRRTADALTLELGRDEPDARLARFVAAYGRTLGALARAGTPVDDVDLRYPQRLRGARAGLPREAVEDGEPETRSETVNAW